ncbi:MAG: hypothetical protein JXB48_12825, partial [Candidatus Latescibacteria bacterium]|nr:hypothetical protein [Candidatus Latescibacterota bacterium]
MFRIICSLILIGFFSVSGVSHAQVINEYTIHKTLTPIEINGDLSEQEWEAAVLTERFVLYVDGAATELNTQAKMLWDDTYLYIAYICEDP